MWREIPFARRHTLQRRPRLLSFRVEFLQEQISQPHDEPRLREDLFAIVYAESGPHTPEPGAL